MGEGIPDYDELKLRIHRGPDDSYQVEVTGPDGSTATGSFSLPFDPGDLALFAADVGRPRRGVRAYRSSRMEEAKRFGTELFEALVHGEVRDVYWGARRLAEARERGLRVTLYLTGVPELMATPWEFLYERPGFLSQSIYTPLVRSLDLPSMRPPRELELPVRVLGMVSGPDGFEGLDVDDERQKLDAALGELAAESTVEVRWLERATLSALERAVSARDEIHVFHYIGHGAYDRRTESGIVVLEDARGGPHEVTGEELGSLLKDQWSLRLVVLNACEGARASQVDPFSGVASSLVECGIPAVIGMQFEITDLAAITFAERVYGMLAQGFPIDAALAQARKAIWAAGNDVEFGTPVLFLRSGDARLFNVQPRPGPEDRATAEPRHAPQPDYPPNDKPADTVPTEAAPTAPPGESADLTTRTELPETEGTTPTKRPRRVTRLWAIGIALAAAAAVALVGFLLVDGGDGTPEPSGAARPAPEVHKFVAVGGRPVAVGFVKPRVWVSNERGEVTWVNEETENLVDGKLSRRKTGNEVGDIAAGEESVWVTHLPDDDGNSLTRWNTKSRRPVRTIPVKGQADEVALAEDGAAWVVSEETEPELHGWLTRFDSSGQRTCPSYPLRTGVNDVTVDGDRVYVALNTGIRGFDRNCGPTGEFLPLEPRPVALDFGAGWLWAVLRDGSAGGVLRIDPQLEPGESCRILINGKTNVNVADNSDALAADENGVWTANNSRRANKGGRITLIDPQTMKVWSHQLKNPGPTRAITIGERLVWVARPMKAGEEGRVTPITKKAAPTRAKCNVE